MPMKSGREEGGSIPHMATDPPGGGDEHSHDYGLVSP